MPRDELVSRGATISGVFHSGAPGAQLDPEGTGDRVNGPDPDHKSYGSFATFEDPDGNSWLLQEVTDRLPGRLDPHHHLVQLRRRPGQGHATRRVSPRRAREARPARLTRIGPTGTPSTWCASRAARSFLYERFRRDRAGRRCARRALRWGHRGAWASGRRRRAGAGRRRVLLLGVHPVQVPLASRGSGPRAPATSGPAPR